MASVPKSAIASYKVGLQARKRYTPESLQKARSRMLKSLEQSPVSGRLKSRSSDAAVLELGQQNILPKEGVDGIVSQANLDASTNLQAEAPEEIEPPEQNEAEKEMNSGRSTGKELQEKSPSAAGTYQPEVDGIKIPPTWKPQ